jgi:RNA polymerase sigma-70 factor (ECF subfamily)
MADDRDRLNALFDALFEATHRRVLAYCLRRVGEPADAEDAAADTYAIAWRRLRDLPAGAELPWLYGVARRVLANQRRGTERRGGLLARLVHRAPAFAETPAMDDGADDGDGPALRALAALRPDDREVLRLVAWEGLDHAGIASVLDITPNAVAIRVHRARRRFAEAYRKESEVTRTSITVTGGVERRPGQEGTP